MWSSLNFFKWCLFLSVGVLCSCVSPPPRRGAPIFVTPASVPVGVRLIDERSSKEVTGGKQRDGFYPKVTSETAFVRFSDDLVKALNAYGAAGACYRLRPGDKESIGAVVLEIRFSSWYARWPHDVSRDAHQVMVEGECEFRWKLTRNGTTLLRGKQRAGLEDLGVPLKALRPNTVEAVIRDALRHQMIQGARRSIEGMLLVISDDWTKLDV